MAVHRRALSDAQLASRRHAATTAGLATTFAYYANSESRANPCNTSQSANEAGMLKISTAPDPYGADPAGPRLEERVYDAAGRVVAARIGTEAWTCSAYEARGRVTRQDFPAFASQGPRSVTYDYAVGGDPLKNAVSDPAGTITTTLDLLGRVVAYSTSPPWREGRRMTTTTWAGTPATAKTSTAPSQIRSSTSRSGTRRPNTGGALLWISNLSIRRPIEMLFGTALEQRACDGSLDVASPWR